MSLVASIIALTERLADEFNELRARRLPRNFNFTRSLDVSINTSADYLRKLELSFDVRSEDVGVYKIDWAYSWNKDSTSVDFMARFLIDGNVFREHVQEAKDAAGNFSTTGSGQRKLLSSFTFLNLAAGPHVFAIEFRPQNAGRRSAMWDASASAQLVQEA